jgi:hypothetical protein
MNDEDFLASEGMKPAGPIIEYSTGVGPVCEIYGSWAWTSPKKKHGAWLFWGISMARNFRELNLII